MLNLTLIKLSISNLCFSPLLVTGKNRATLSNVHIYNSFSTGIVAERYLLVSNSIFRNFLSSAIKVSSSKRILETDIKDSTINFPPGSTIQNTLFRRCISSYSNNGGGIHCQNTKIKVENCFFAYCEAPEKGGAIYAIFNNLYDVSIQNTRVYYCTASEGSSFMIINSNHCSIEQSSIEESAPSYRTGLESNCHIITRHDQLTNINFTSCYSQLSSAALKVDSSESRTIKFTTFQNCVGYNIICLKGLSTNSFIEKVIMNDNKLNGIQNSIGNDRYEGNSLICIMGHWRINDGFFNLNKVSQLASGGYGFATFFRCLFDESSEFISQNHNIEFLECSFNRVDFLPTYSFTVNEIEFEGPNYFKGETARTIEKPPKAKFLLSKRIAYIICGIIFTLVFITVTVLACNMLKRHRKHVLCKLHQVYAKEAQSNDGNADDINDKDLVVVVDEKDKKKKEKEIKEKENDFDDFFYITKKDNRFEFKDIEVPDTHLWDTDEGDVDVPDEDAFVNNVNNIADIFNVKEKSKKGKKKKKKLSLIKKKK